MFLGFLIELRAAGCLVGLSEWRAFLDALSGGLIASLDELYTIGRALLCRTEADYDRFDAAFVASFNNARLPDDLREKVARWLERRASPEGERVDPGIPDEDLWNELLERLSQQQREHHGGNRMVGTGGTSPFGHSGRATRGIRMGGAGGGRSAVQVAMERRWENYRRDRTLDVRQFEVALRTLRKLTREGRLELDLDGTIRRTCDNAGDIEIVERPERQNQVHLVLLMDAGGSMAPHHERVSQLFSAATRANVFKSFTAYSFHNCIYGWLYRDIAQLERMPAEKVLSEMGSAHRVIMVGDASMAPYELFGSFAWPGQDVSGSGLAWLKRFKARCPSSVWLNPDPRRFWNHPTVDAIGRVFPMFELTIAGLEGAIRKLRAPA